ncbi:3-oxoacyl-ACP synthase III family protein [Aliarcobacter butzleri]|uniref:3-oxoacyl-ACP synthase III family protein n=1 Tax=Aliarcobacter butzleri TaxID=28197 RepID=UPI0021B43574|nr:ketoacyl-ACP synthase III [Aliarcobacter butzleri]MCT7537423.1 ketoacyl-ACP synthase III [Aliarcobacter butzleri]MCT7623902.1 ketoacyl-ACP synthase III [Aliarcobacter butzleri]
MFKIGTYLPSKVLSNEDLEYLGWSAKKIFLKTGIKQRHITVENETALDLACKACEDLFSKYEIDRNEVDYILYCTQSPDYNLPNNVSILHKKLNLKNNIPSLEFNQGCSGYIYGLSLAKALINTNLATKILLVTSDTYTKYIDNEDRTNKTIFGDGSTATLLTKNEIDKFGEFIFGTDGKGSCNLCVNNSGLSKEKLTQDGFEDKLFMNGSEIFNFTLETVPNSIEKVLEKNSLNFEDIDYFLFHQANDFMLEHLREKLDIPKGRFPKFIENTGNTVSSTIPFLINDLNEKKVLKKGDKLLLIGFGVGYSWGATIVEY